MRLFVELKKSGTSVLIATHDVALMDQYDARRLVLHDGGFRRSGLIARLTTCATDRREDTAPRLCEPMVARVNPILPTQR